MVYQGGYELPCKHYIAGVYSDSDDDDDDECDDSPIASGSGKASLPIKIDVFKIDATLFCWSLPHCIPVSLGFSEIDGRDKGCMCPCSSKLSSWWKTSRFSKKLSYEFNCQIFAMKPSALIAHTKN